MKNILYRFTIIGCLGFQSMLPMMTSQETSTIKRFLRASEHIVQAKKFKIFATATVAIGVVLWWKYSTTHKKRKDPKPPTLPPALDVKVRAIKAAQLAKLRHISSDSITTVYSWHSYRFLITPQQTRTYAQLKELFEKYATAGIMRLATEATGPWSDAVWLEMMQGIEEGTKKPYSKDYMMCIDSLDRLVNDARSILKAFLLPHEDDIIALIETSLKKTRFRRICTYVELQRVIAHKGLSHVRLPLKVFVIQDKKTGRYVTGREAENIIDTIVKIQLSAGDTRAFLIKNDHPDYNFFILADRQRCSKVPLSRVALEELRELVKEVPFDVGYNNIFSDDDGNAVIIDTENKGEPASGCLPKLEGYNSTGSPLDLYGYA